MLDKYDSVFSLIRKCSLNMTAEDEDYIYGNQTVLYGFWNMSTIIDPVSSIIKSIRRNLPKMDVRSLIKTYGPGVLKAFLKTVPGIPPLAIDLADQALRAFEDNSEQEESWPNGTSNGK